jgi:uncharacterized protein (TIGR02265 family)
VQQIKGGVLKSRLAFVEEQFGKDKLELVLASLGEADRKTLAMLATLKWYPFDVGKALDRAIVDVVGGGDPAFFERLGVASADRNLTTVHKSFITPGDPHGFLSKTPAIYSMYYETGRREYQSIGDREAVLITHEAETFSAPDCRTVIGWHRRALEMCGAADVHIVEEECRATGGAVCRYRMTWS